MGLYDRIALTVALIGLAIIAFSATMAIMDENRDCLSGHRSTSAHYIHVGKTLTVSHSPHMVCDEYAK